MKLFRHRLASRFRSDQRGVAAIEFALIAPVLATMMMGLCDVGEALISDRMMVETAEALVRGANALIVPAQCSFTGSGASTTQSCTPASMSSDSTDTLVNVLRISMTGTTLGGTSFSNVNATVYRVVNNNGSYAVANTFVISGSSQALDPATLSNYLPSGGSTLVATISYQQTMLFPFFSVSLPLSTRYTL
jgi:Flp pilus assembly protein TadG